MKFWALFDSSAQMGHVTFDFDVRGCEEATINTRIKQLFLTNGYGSDEPLRHCDFMVGYLHATTDVASLLWTRWIRKSIFAKPEVAWRTTECINAGQERDEITAFRINARPERFKEVRDTLALAIDACQNGTWVEAMIDARICLENSLLLITGHELGTRFSFGRLLEQLKNVRANLDYEKWRVAYASCSEFAHQVKAHNEIAVLGYLFTVWECVCEAENVELSTEQTGLLIKAKDKYITP